MKWWWGSPMSPKWVMGPPWSPKNLPTGSLLPAFLKQNVASGVGTWERPRFLWASWCGRPPSMESPPGPTSHGTMAQHHLPVIDRCYINLHELELLSVYVCFCFPFVTIFSDCSIAANWGNSNFWRQTETSHGPILHVQWRSAKSSWLGARAPCFTVLPHTHWVEQLLLYYSRKNLQKKKHTILESHGFL